MTSPIKFTATMRAWLTGTGYQLRDLQRAIAAKSDIEVIDALTFSNCDMETGANPWVPVGTAEVTVTLESRDAVVTAALAALQRELEHERAAWLTKQQAILDRISKLQALEYVEA